jgi:ABC-type lipoprotein release transport system permease subunit
MLTLKLAWRGFVRHRWRSAITAAAVSLGLAMLLAFVGIADDAHARMAELGIRMGSGNVLVEAKGYRDAQTLDYVVHDADHIAEIVAKQSGVSAVAVRLRESGLVSAGEHSAPVMVSGVDPKREALASDLTGEQLRVAGKYIRPRSEMEFAGLPADIYIGKTLAERLEVEVGDRVVLTLSPPGDAEPAQAAFRVRGVFKSGADDLDGGYVEIPIEEARTLLHLPGAATEVAALTNLESTQSVHDEIARALASHAELAVIPWQIALRELYEALVLDNAGLYLMMAIVFVVVALGIFNTVLMSVVERTRELGVMMALGTSGSRLFALVLGEALVLALVSLVVGVAAGLGLHLFVAHHGIDVRAWAGEVQFAGIAWSGMIYSRLSAEVVAGWTAAVGVVVMLSALYPAWTVTRLEPVEAMRHV